MVHGAVVWNTLLLVGLAGSSPLAASLANVVQGRFSIVFKNFRILLTKLFVVANRFFGVNDVIGVNRAVPSEGRSSSNSHSLLQYLILVPLEVGYFEKMV